MQATSEENISANPNTGLQIDHFYHMMKQFYPNVSDLFQDDSKGHNSSLKDAIRMIIICYGYDTHQIPTLFTYDRFWSVID